MGGSESSPTAYVGKFSHSLYRKGTLFIIVRLGEMFEGESADMCAGKFTYLWMVGQAVGLACADPGARTPISVSENYLTLALRRKFISLNRIEKPNAWIPAQAQGQKSIGNTGTAFPGRQEFCRKEGAFNKQNQEDRWYF